VITQAGAVAQPFQITQAAAVTRVFFKLEKYEIEFWHMSMGEVINHKLAARGGI